MPLSRAQMEALRDECLADDIEIDFDRMKDWSADHLRAFFENGGVEPEPPREAPPPRSERLSADADYYETLGLQRSADATEIKKAYRKLAIKFHPDKNPHNLEDAEANFKLVSEAYEVLSDPAQRASYDRFGKDGVKGRAGSVDPNELFRQMFEGMQDMLAQMMAGGVGSGTDPRVPHPGMAGFGFGVHGAAGHGVRVEIDLASLFGQMGGMNMGGAGFVNVRPPRTAHAYEQLCHTLQAKYGDAPTPPAAAADGWSRAELTRFYQSSGKWKPLVERTNNGAMLNKLGWRTRLDKALRRGMHVSFLDGGAMSAAEGRPEHYATVVDALANNGFCAVNFGVKGRYSDFDPLSQACAELDAMCKMSKPSVDSETGELSVSTRMLGRGSCPALQGINESLTNFVLGLRNTMAESSLGVQLTAYTETKFSVMLPGASTSKARFDREGPPDESGPERRVDSSDGCSYTQQEFIDFYGPSWQARWASAKPPTGNEDKRKLSAILFLDHDWQARNGGMTTVYDFDDVKGTFSALELAPQGDTLLLFRSDRVLYQFTSLQNKPRHAISVQFLGHYV